MSERLLIRYPLFELLDAQVLHALMEDAVSADFETGEVLFQEGATGAWLHFLIEGRVRILRRSESGRDVSLGIVKEGELFGEYVLLTPHQHTATCRAAARCRVLRLPLQKVRAALRAAKIDGHLMKQLIRLQASTNFVTGLHYLGFMSAPSALTYAESLKPEHFRGMRTLCGPGLAKDRWFHITNGSAILSDKYGRCLELGPGDCFGSLCLTGLHSEETVSTLTELNCLSLAVTDFLQPPGSLPRRDADNADLSASSQVQTLQTRHIPASRFPFIAQREESDCGLAALAMVAMSLGVPVSDSIYEQAGELSEHGLSLLQLRNLARSVRLSAEAYRIDPEHLLDLVCPFIAHLNDGHFVVVCYADDHRAMIADPATSVHSITDEKLKEIWSGNVITVQLPAK